MNGEDEGDSMKLGDRLLKLSAVAKIFCVSERTVRRLIDTGELVACKVLGSVRIPFSAVQKYYRKITGGMDLRS